MVFIEFFEEIMDYSPWFSLNFFPKTHDIDLVHGHLKKNVFLRGEH